jgi:hypothetical protein
MVSIPLRSSASPRSQVQLPTHAPVTLTVGALSGGACDEAQLAVTRAATPMIWFLPVGGILGLVSPWQGALCPAALRGSMGRAMYGEAPCTGTPRASSARSAASPASSADSRADNSTRGAG